MAIDPMTGLETQDNQQENSLLSSEAPVNPTPTVTAVTPEQTVSGQLSQLLAQDSPYITQARTSAAERGQRSGLLSSSLAAGAGEGAAIKAALPIAQQDAKTAADFGLLAQTGAQNISLAEKRGEISSVLQTEGAQQQKELQSEGAIQRLELENTAAANALKLQEAKDKNNLALETFAQTQQNNRLALELKNKLEIVNNQVLAENKQVFTEATGRMFQQYQDTFSKIQTTADDILDAGEKNRLITQNQIQLQNQVDTLASLYSIPLVWG